MMTEREHPVALTTVNETDSVSEEIFPQTSASCPVILSVVEDAVPLDPGEPSSRHEEHIGLVPLLAEITLSVLYVCNAVIKKGKLTFKRVGMAKHGFSFA
jgi:hypothetical protein